MRQKNEQMSFFDPFLVSYAALVATGIPFSTAVQIEVDQMYLISAAGRATNENIGGAPNENIARATNENIARSTNENIQRATK